MAGEKVFAARLTTRRVGKGLSEVDRRVGKDAIARTIDGDELDGMLNRRTHGTDRQSHCHEGEEEEKALTPHREMNDQTRPDQTRPGEGIRINSRQGRRE
jgi:hypothetical protein